MKPIHVIFRDLNPHVVAAVAAAAPPEWDVKQGDIFQAGRATYIVSPANCIGRMDGGIDAAYIRHFGWQLQQRLCHHLFEDYGSKADPRGYIGRVEIGDATSVRTNDPMISELIMAPTMDWPPGDVSRTQNAYLAFRAALRLVPRNTGATVLTPGLCTLTGRMAPQDCAEQMVRAWREVCAA